MQSCVGDKKMNVCEKHIENIVESNLCTGCGVCVAVCPKNVLKLEAGICRIEDQDKCIDCGLCKRCCPSYGYELFELGNSFLGAYKAESNNEKIKGQCTSGGAITQMLCDAICTGFVDKVTIVRGKKSIDSGLCEYVSTFSVEEIIEAAGSHYVIAPVDKILREIRRSAERYIVVAPPCILYGISKAMAFDKKLKNNIRLKIGFICGYTYEQTCVEGLSKYCGVDSDTVKCVKGWREEGFPGNTILKTKSGDELKIPFADEHSIDVTFFANKKCLLCKDCFGDYGDIVAGDLGKGWSERKTLLFTRSERGQVFLDNYMRGLDITKLQVSELKEIPLQFMEIEKRSKVTIRKEQFGYTLPEWTGTYNERKLLPIRRAVARYIDRCQNTARNQKDYFLKNPQKLLQTGKKCYGGFENKRVIRYAFFAERAVQVAAGINWKTFFNSKIQNKKSQCCTEPFINVGIIGLGAWGIQYVALLFKDEHYNLLSVCDTDISICEKVERRYGVKSQTIDDMLSDDRIDTIIVLVPNFLHEEIIVEAVRKGKNVFVEKPLTNDLLSALRIEQTLRETDKHIYVAHSMKCGRGFRKLKQIIESGELGVIRQFSAVRSLHGLGMETRLSWRSDEKLAPMLPLLQLGIHLIDAVIYLLGNVTCVGAEAHSTYGVVDSVSCLVSASGIPGCIQSSYDAENTMELVIYGSKKTAILSSDKLQIISGGKRKIIEKKLESENPLEFELNEYWRWIKCGEEPINTFRRAIQVVKVFDEICCIVRGDEGFHAE